MFNVHASATTDTYRPGMAQTLANVVMAIYSHPLPTDIVAIRQAIGSWEGVQENSVMLTVPTYRDALSLALTLRKALAQDSVLVAPASAPRIPATGDNWTQLLGTGQPRWQYRDEDITLV